MTVRGQLPLNTSELGPPAAGPLEKPQHVTNAEFFKAELVAFHTALGAPSDCAKWATRPPTCSGLAVQGFRISGVPSGVTGSIWGALGVELEGGCRVGEIRDWARTLSDPKTTLHLAFLNTPGT